MAQTYFWLFSLVGVLCACGVLTARHPITGAVNLIGVMLSLAGVYALLAGPFLAIVQMLVYAGAIMMLVVFVIMVLNSATDRTARGTGLLLLPGLAVGGGLVAAAWFVLRQSGPALAEDAAAPVGTIETLAATLFAFEGGQGWYLLFEVVGLVLLASLTGAVMLAKRSLASPEPAGYVPEPADEHAQHDAHDAAHDAPAAAAAPAEPQPAAAGASA